MKIEFALESPEFRASGEPHKWWPMKPCTGVFWADTLWLAVLCALDRHIVPYVTGNIIPFDLVTPWLVVSFVAGTPTHSLFIWLLASLFLETSSTVPRGLYLCSYWIILATLLLVRNTLSWRHVVPWLVTMFVAIFFICNFETIILLVKEDFGQLDVFYFLNQLVRVTLSCFIGMALAQPWMNRFHGERIKGERK